MSRRGKCAVPVAEAFMVFMYIPLRLYNNNMRNAEAIPHSRNKTCAGGILTIRDERGYQLCFGLARRLHEHASECCGVSPLTSGAAPMHVPQASMVRSATSARANHAMSMCARNNEQHCATLPEDSCHHPPTATCRHVSHPQDKDSSLVCRTKGFSSIRKVSLCASC